MSLLCVSNVFSALLLVTFFFSKQDASMHIVEVPARAKDLVLDMSNVSLPFSLPKFSPI